MPDLPDWPDALIVARAVLLDLCPNIGPATPPDPQGTGSWMPFIRLGVIGGNDDTVTDVTTLQVDCFASSRGAASQLAGRVRQRITATPPPQAPGVGVIDFGATVSKPQNIPQAAAGTFMFAATYFIHMRRL